MWLADKPGEYMVSHINFIFISSELFYYVSGWQRKIHCSLTFSLFPFHI